VRRFANLKFFLSWWAYSFPLAAITIASLVMFQHTGGTLFLRLSGVLLARTALAVKRQEICVEE